MRERQARTFTQRADERDSTMHVFQHGGLHRPATPRRLPQLQKDDEEGILRRAVYKDDEGVVSMMVAMNSQLQKEEEEEDERDRECSSPYLKLPPFWPAKGLKTACHLLSEDIHKDLRAACGSEIPFPRACCHTPPSSAELHLLNHPSPRMITKVMEQKIESAKMVSNIGACSSLLGLSAPKKEGEMRSLLRVRNARGAKRLARSMHGVSNRSMVASLTKVKAACDRIEADQISHKDYLCDLKSALDAQRGSTLKLREHLEEWKLEILCNQAQLQIDVSRIERTQQTILHLLESINNELEKRTLNNLQEDSLAILNVVPELRGDANKLNTIAKLQSSGVSELRATSNKLIAMTKSLQK